MAVTRKNYTPPAPAPYPHGAIGAPYQSINPLGFSTGGHFTIDKSPVCGEMAVMTPHGQVKINLDTGVLTIPHGIGREEAIRDFWLGFQENFRGAEKTKYENEIHSLKKEIEHISQRADEYRKHADDVVKESIVKKISEKYGNEKFIMMKPVDLIKMIEKA